MTTALTVVDPTSIPMTRSVTDTGVSLPAPAAENQAFEPFCCGDSRVSHAKSPILVTRQAAIGCPIAWFLAGARQDIPEPGATVRRRAVGRWLGMLARHLVVSFLAGLVGCSVPGLALADYAAPPESPYRSEPGIERNSGFSPTPERAEPESPFAETRSRSTATAVPTAGSACATTC